MPLRVPPPTRAWQQQCRSEKHQDFGDRRETGQDRWEVAQAGQGQPGAPWAPTIASQHGALTEAVCPGGDPGVWHSSAPVLSFPAVLSPPSSTHMGLAERTSSRPARAAQLPTPSPRLCVCRRDGREGRMPRAPCTRRPASSAIATASPSAPSLAAAGLTARARASLQQAAPRGPPGSRSFAVLARGGARCSPWSGSPQPGSPRGTARAGRGELGQRPSGRRL